MIFVISFYFRFLNLITELCLEFELLLLHIIFKNNTLLLAYLKLLYAVYFFLLKSGKLYMLHFTSDNLEV